MSNILPREKQAQIIQSLCEGNSIRSTSRLTGAYVNTIMSLMLRAGKACRMWHDQHARNLHPEQIQVDEFWSFIYAKENRVRHIRRAYDYAGDIWTFVAIDPDSKLVISWLVGERNHYHATQIMEDVASRVESHIQMSTNMLASYADAVERAFGCEVDYGQIIKTYTRPDPNLPPPRASSGLLVQVAKRAIFGNPDRAFISTSIVERLNASTRQHLKRTARATLAFSKKRENFIASVDLHFTYYNLCRVHSSLHITPAMAAGITDHIWEPMDLVLWMESMPR